MLPSTNVFFLLHETDDACHTEQRQPLPSEAHFDSEFGVKFGLAGISGGEEQALQNMYISSWL